MASSAKWSHRAGSPAATSCTERTGTKAGKARFQSVNTHCQCALGKQCSLQARLPTAAKLGATMAGRLQPNSKPCLRQQVVCCKGVHAHRLHRPSNLQGHAVPGLQLVRVCRRAREQIQRRLGDSREGREGTLSKAPASAALHQAACTGTVTPADTQTLVVTRSFHTHRCRAAAPAPAGRTAGPP